MCTISLKVGFMRLTFILTLLLRATVDVAAQTIFSDAEEINLAFSKEKDYKRGFVIIANYLNLPAGSTSIGEIKKALENNRYLLDVITPIADRSEQERIERINALQISDLKRMRDPRIDEALRSLEQFKVNPNLLAEQADLIAEGRRISKYLDSIQGMNAESLRGKLPSEKLIDANIKYLDTLKEARLSEINRRLKMIDDEKQAAEKRSNEQLAAIKETLVKTRQTDQTIRTTISGIDELQSWEIIPIITDNPNVPSTTNITVGSVSQTSLIDGAATFVANRIKQEVKAKFFDNFKEEIMGAPGLEILFPNTVNLWKAFASYDYSDYLNLFQTSFRQDLSELTFHIPKYLRTVNGADKNLELDFMIALAESYKFMIEGQSLAAAISSFSRNEEVAWNPQFKLGARYMAIFSSALRRSDATGRTWIKRGELTEVLKSEQHSNILLGLMYQRILNANREFRANTTVDNTLLVESETAFKYADNFRKRLNSLIDLFENIDRVQQSLQDKRPLLKEDLLHLYHFADNIIIYAAESFGNEYLAHRDKIKETLKETEALFDATMRSDYSTLVFGVYRLIEPRIKADSSKRSIRLFLKYGSFMAQISSAKNAEDVTKALDAAALPVGSYGAKRRNPLTLELSTYPGFLVGAEKAKPESGYTGTVGFTAPVGLSLSWPTKKKGASSGAKMFDENRSYTGNSITCFVTVVDLAAPVLYRLGHGDAEGLPEEVTISQFISPGISIGHSLSPKSPFYLMAGIQYTPKLREFGTELESVARFNLTFAMDIPIFNLFTNQSTVKKRVKKSEHKGNDKNSSRNPKPLTSQAAKGT